MEQAHSPESSRPTGSSKQARSTFAENAELPLRRLMKWDGIMAKRPDVTAVFLLMTFASKDGAELDILEDVKLRSKVKTRLLCVVHLFSLKSPIPGLPKVYAPNSLSSSESF